MYNQKHDATMGVVQVNFGDGTGVRVTPEGVFGISFKQVGDVTSANGSTFPIAPQPISVVAEYDSESGEGIILKAKVRNQTKLIEMPRETLGSSHKRQAIVFREGVKLDLHSKRQDPFWRYCQAAEPATRVKRFDSTGWQTTDEGKDIYIVGREPNGTPIIWGQPQSVKKEDIPPYSFTAGRREFLPSLICHDDATAWTKAITRALDDGYQLAVAAASLAFGSTLLRPLGIRCHGGVVFCGDSSTGKTNAIRMARAAAGWNVLHGERKIESFTSSQKQLHRKTEAYRDQIMCIEETQCVSAQEFADFVMAASGLSRGTLNQDSSIREAYGCPVLWLGCGEASPTSKLEEARAQTGHYHRVLGIDAGHPALYKAQEHHKVQEFERLMEQTSGYACKRFVEHICNADEATLEDWRSKHQDFTLKILNGNGITDPNGAQSRAAARLAIGVLGGTLARAIGLIPAKAKILELFQTMFGVWLKQDGATKTDAARLAAQKLVSFVEENTGSGFLEGGFYDERYRPRARGKLYGWVDEGTLYITRPALQTSLAGYGVTPFCRRLAAEQAIDSRNGTYSFKTPEKVTSNRELSKIRTYRIDMEKLRSFAGIETAKEEDK